MDVVRHVEIRKFFRQIGNSDILKRNIVRFVFAKLYAINKCAKINTKKRIRE